MLLFSFSFPNGRERFVEYFYFYFYLSMVSVIGRSLESALMCLIVQSERRKQQLRYSSHKNLQQQYHDCLADLFHISADP